MKGEQTNMYDRHTNAFLEMHGIPYLLAEYVDRERFEQVDRSMIYSAINIDTTDPARAVIDISMDDIGKRASDGLPNVLDNDTKQKDVLDAVHRLFRGTNQAIPVIKRGLVARVNYQIENGRTGQVLRSIYEDIRIPERQYFISITPNDIEHNSIITNFTTTQVSTINQFTHGTDPMTLRVTSVQLCYEVMKSNDLRPRGRKDRPYQRMEDLAPMEYRERYGIYEYHKHTQNTQFLGESLLDHPSNIYPYEWFGYNRLYHFSNDYKDMILHMEDIYNHYAKTTLIECGKLIVNRAFIVNPGERLVFKMSIWKNDLAIFNDTSSVARALDYQYSPWDDPRRDWTHGDSFCPKSAVDEFQNDEIAHINHNIHHLYHMIEDIKRGIYPPWPPYPWPPTPEPDPEPKPDPHPCPPPFPPGPHPPRKDMIRKILQTIRTMQEDIKKLQQSSEGIPVITPITDEEIDEILDGIDDDDLPDISELDGIEDDDNTI